MRVGVVDYLNSLTLTWRLGEVLPRDTVVADVPSRLNRAFARGELDAAFVSAGYLPYCPAGTQVLDLGIAARGPVWSVLLFHPGSLTELRDVAVTRASDTSALLLRVLLEREGLAHVRFEHLGEGEAVSPRSGRGVLLIGDSALGWRGRWPARDLGEWWEGITGLPMVYAVLAVRPEVPRAEGRRLREVLVAHQAENRSRMGSLLQGAPAGSPLSPGDLEA